MAISCFNKSFKELNNVESKDLRALLYKLRADSFLMQGKKERAIKDLEKAIELNVCDKASKKQLEKIRNEKQV